MLSCRALKNIVCYSVAKSSFPSSERFSFTSGKRKNSRPFILQAPDIKSYFLCFLTTWEAVSSNFRFTWKKSKTRSDFSPASRKKKEKLADKFCQRVLLRVLLFDLCHSFAPNNKDKLYPGTKKSISFSPAESSLWLEGLAFLKFKPQDFYRKFTTLKTG